MTALKNMKIRSKLILGFGLLLFVTAAIAVVGAISLFRVDRDYNYVLEFPNARYSDMRQLEVGLMDLRRIITMAAFLTGDPAAISGVERDLDDARAVMRTTIDRFNQNVIDDPTFDDTTRRERQRQTGELESLIFDYLENIANPIVYAARQGNLYRVMEIIPMATSYNNEIDAQFYVLFNNIAEIVEQTGAETVAMSRRTLFILLGLSLGGLAIGIVIALIISSMITKPIKNVLVALGDVAAGNLNVNINKSNITRDETGQLTQNVLRLVDVIQNISREVHAMIDAATIKGDLHFHIDAEKYNGDWREITEGLNHIAEAVDRPIVEIREAMIALDEGNFDTFITGDYTGDFLSIKNSVNTTIKDMAEYIHDIEACLNAVAEGNLTRYTSKDIRWVGEYATISQSIDQIIKRLHDIMSEISVASSHVLTGASQISTSATDLAVGAQEQAATVEELSTSIDLINQQTQQNAENASQANVLSVKSTENAREGNEAMSQMLLAMTKINESSNSISKVIETIQGITFQTNLLSLNAAVEAARAGEQGRGFGVVAEEVRSLATRSKDATMETTDLIHESLIHVGAGSHLAQITSESLSVMVDDANSILEIIKGISIASKEQADAIAQISIGITQISEVVQNNSAVSEETATASEELNAQAEILQQLVSFFRL